jgi:hypothetical protein
MINRASRTIRTPSGEAIVLSSDQHSQADLVVAEVLLELCAERGTTEFTFSDEDMDEIARRVRAKGYDPNTGESIQ